jgi:hypothetical protein
LHSTKSSKESTDSWKDPLYCLRSHSKKSTGRDSNSQSELNSSRINLKLSRFGSIKRNLTTLISKKSMRQSAWRIKSTSKSSERWRRSFKVPTKKKKDWLGYLKRNGKQPITLKHKSKIWKSIN